MLVDTAIYLVFDFEFGLVCLTDQSTEGSTSARCSADAWPGAREQRGTSSGLTHTHKARTRVVHCESADSKTERVSGMLLLAQFYELPLRQGVQIKLAISTNQSMLTPGVRVLALTEQTEQSYARQTEAGILIKPAPAVKKTKPHSYRRRWVACQTKVYGCKQELEKTTSFISRTALMV